MCISSVISYVFHCVPPSSARPYNKLMPRNQVLLRPQGGALHIAHVQDSSQLSLRKLAEPRILEPGRNLHGVEILPPLSLEIEIKCEMKLSPVLPKKKNLG